MLRCRGDAAVASWIVRWTVLRRQRKRSGRGAAATRRRDDRPDATISPGVYVALGIFVACFPCLCFFLFQKRRANLAAEDAERLAHVELADASPAEFAAAAVVDEGDGATPEVHAVAVDEVKAVLRPSSGPSFWEPERRPSAYAAAAPEDDDASTSI